MITKSFRPILAAAFVALILPSAFGKPPTSAEQLRSEFETALKAGDTNAVLSLVNWKGVSPEMKSEMVEAMWDAPDVSSVKILPLPSDFQATNELDGIRRFPNIHVEGLLEVESKESGGYPYPYGKSDGVFYITGIIQEKLVPSAKTP